MNAINCCKGCVSPKRHKACWGDCPEYLEQKAEHDSLKAKDYEQRRIKNGIYQQRADRVVKAERRHGRKI